MKTETINRLRQIVIPQFEISHTQHCRIMEILGIKTYRGKKEFINYSIKLKEEFIK